MQEALEHEASLFGSLSLALASGYIQWMHTVGLDALGLFPSGRRVAVNIYNYMINAMDTARQKAAVVTNHGPVEAV